MIRRALALWRDMGRTQQIASPQEEAWLRSLWASHLRDLNPEEEAREKRVGWYAVVRDLVIAVALAGAGALYVAWVAQH